MKHFLYIITFIAFYSKRHIFNVTQKIRGDLNKVNSSPILKVSIVSFCARI